MISEMRSYSLILIFFLLISSFFIINSNAEETEGGEIEPGKGVFNIIGDEDLLDHASENGWTGSGNKSDPIRIENLSIEYPDGSLGINISETTLHLMIANCNFSELKGPPGILPGNPAALVIDGSKNIIVDNCSMKCERGFPVYIKNCEGIGISGTRMYSEGPFHMVYIYDSKNISLEGSTIESNLNSDGFLVEVGENCSIENCTLKGLNYGVTLYSARKGRVADNDISSLNFTGIRLIYTEEVSIINNTMEGIEEIDSHEDNSLGMFLVYLDDCEISGNRILCNSGISVNSCTRLEIHENLITTEGLNIDMNTCEGMNLNNNELNGKGLYIVECGIGIDLSGSSLNGGEIFYRFGQNLEGVTIPPDSTQVILDSVENADLSDLNFDGIDFPVILEESSRIDISDCKMNGCETGIFAWLCDNLTVTDTRISTSIHGIQFFDVDDSLLSRSHLQSNVFTFVLSGSARNRIEDSTLVSDGKGIDINNCKGTQVIGNEIEGKPAVNLIRSLDVRIEDNEFTGGRIRFGPNIDFERISSPQGNTQNGNPIHYFFNDLSTSAISEDGIYFFFYNIREKVISEVNADHEIVFMECSDLSILNFTVKGNEGSLKFDLCERVEIVNLVIDEGPGLLIDRSNRISIMDSRITNCSQGIEVNQSGNIIVSRCNISFNNGEGISFLNTTYESTISYSWIGYNKGNGIEIVSSDGNSIIWNDLVSNVGYGVSISYSIETRVNSNHFVNNNGLFEGFDPERSQAYSMHEENYFFVNDPETRRGNYWSDYNDPELDNDGDGFIDVPYMIESEEGNEDVFPSVKRFDYIEVEGRYSIGGDDWILIISTGTVILLLVTAIFFTILISGWLRR
jgi:parallel beta-helix repeat protein